MLWLRCDDLSKHIIYEASSSVNDRACVSVWCGRLPRHAIYVRGSLRLLWDQLYSIYWLLLFGVLEQPIGVFSNSTYRRIWSQGGLLVLSLGLGIPPKVVTEAVSPTISEWCLSQKSCSHLWKFFPSSISSVFIYIALVVAQKGPYSGWAGFLPRLAIISLFQVVVLGLR